ncbi:MAG: hypothetical protein HDR21_07255 [Lachnospiraceae bacterium]|nr:hypothetical protein [Lachnospiraceae bacterium]
MNIRKFKEIVGTWENCEENFRLFRIYAENCYILYEKNYNLEIAEATQHFANASKIDEIEYDWTGIVYKDVVMTYSEMGWKLDEKIRETIMSRDNEWDYFYYKVAFPDIYEKIETLEDDVEFSYAILSVIKNVVTNCSLYSEFVKWLYNGLREYELFSVIDMIGKEQKKKAFIAMSFEDSMKKTRKAIVDAVQSCGYVPMLIDIKEHNNQIVPEIYKEISDSKFVIADLTGQRGGVYYEAGYAVAKEKILILSCKKGENPHFDVAQINTIFWVDEQDLKDRLIKRIKATIGVNA